MGSFNKKEYDVNFRQKALKEKKKAQFNTDLSYETKQNIDKFLQENNLNKADFIEKSYKILEKGMYMRKYLVYKNTQHFEKRGDWVSTGDCADTKEIKIFNNKENAEKYYNELKLNDVVETNDRYSDYKSIYEYDATEITDEMINNDEYDLEDMKFIKDDYSFIG